MSYELLRKGRVSAVGHIYLVTTVTAGRERLFEDVQAGRCIVHAMRDLDCRRVTRTLAYCVMPDHVHWLFELIGKDSLSAVVKRFKGASARALNCRQSRRDSIWQPSFHDHAVRTDKALVQIARYVVMNPVRAGLVTRIGEYPLWDAIWLTSE